MKLFFCVCISYNFQLHVTGSMQISGVFQPVSKTDIRKGFYVYVLQSEPDHVKISNLLQHYSVHLPVMPIPDGTGLQGHSVKITSKNINCKLDRAILQEMKSGIAGLSGKLVTVNFRLSRYDFISKKPQNFGERIQGYNFVLEKLKLI